jgi:Uma2 family endonuclease
LDGEVVEMAPALEPHVVSVTVTGDALREVCPADCHVRSQASFDLSETSEPEPDVEVVKGKARDYLPEHPGPDAMLLAVEVADSSLRQDRTRKAGLYAAGLIPEYWIVNLRQRQLEVFRDPIQDATARWGGRYVTTFIVPADGHVEPLCAPGKQVAVRDLLP